jgi:hypothetical protein
MRTILTKEKKGANLGEYSLSAMTTVEPQTGERGV